MDGLALLPSQRSTAQASTRPTPGAKAWASRGSLKTCSRIVRAVSQSKPAIARPVMTPVNAESNSTRCQRRVRIWSGRPLRYCQVFRHRGPRTATSAQPRRSSRHNRSARSIVRPPRCREPWNAIVLPVRDTAKAQELQLRRVPTDGCRCPRLSVVRVLCVRRAERHSDGVSVHPILVRTSGQIESPSKERHVAP